MRPSRRVIASVESFDLRRLFAIAIVDANGDNNGAANKSAFGYDVSADGR